MRELDGQHVIHRCILLAPRGMPESQIQLVKAEAHISFSNVRSLQTTRLEERPWPIAPNAMFRCFLRWALKSQEKYFWWNEPDCIPLKSKWLDLLEEEYIKSGKPFMGSIVDKPCRHLTGCAIYPFDASRYNPALEVGPENIAWDCIEPLKTIPHAHHTELFHHQWFGFDGTGVSTFQTVSELEKISRKAVVFHRNKDHTLIDRMRENRTALENPMQAGRRHRLTVRRTKRTADAVYTYYEPIGRPQETRIIELWHASWTAHGWKPVLIGDKDIGHFQAWKTYVRAVSEFPSVNPPGYDLACFKRWPAMVAQGGGMMVDYDVLNYGFTPEMANELKNENALVFLDGHVPCAVIGEKRLFKFACEYMKNYRVAETDLEGGKPHMSDMMLLMKAIGSPWLKSVPVVVEYGKDGWETARLVHYCTCKTSGDKLAAIAKHP